MTWWALLLLVGVAWIMFGFGFFLGVICQKNAPRAEPLDPDEFDLLPGDWSPDFIKQFIHRGRP